MIAGALLTLLASGAYFAGSSIKTNVNIYKNAERMNDEGASWKSDAAAEIMLRKDIERLWEEGKRDFVPEELVELFENEPWARSDYFDGLAAECMILKGFKPKDAGSGFNRYTYDCYSQYNQSYNGKMNEWLRINRPAVMRKKLDDLNRKKQEAREAHMKYLRKKNRHYAAIALLCAIVALVGLVLTEQVRARYMQEYDFEEIVNMAVERNDEYKAGEAMIVLALSVMLLDYIFWFTFRSTYTVEDGFKECWNDFVKWLNTQSQRAKERRAELKK